MTKKLKKRLPPLYFHPCMPSVQYPHTIWKMRQSKAPGKNNLIIKRVLVGFVFFLVFLENCSQFLPRQIIIAVNIFMLYAKINKDQWDENKSSKNNCSLLYYFT